LDISWRDYNFYNDEVSTVSLMALYEQTAFYDTVGVLLSTFRHCRQPD